jgi:DNA-binding XRE family transcriptional regulator
MTNYIQPVTLAIEALKAADESLSVFVETPQDLEIGTYWIDFGFEKRQDAITYNAASGYGVFTQDDHPFQTRPDEIYKDAKLAAKRALSLLKRKNKTMLPQDLRNLLNKTQVEMAALLNVNQAAISKFESRDDVKLSTFNDYVTALGGRLEVNVVFPEFSARVNVGKAS